MSTKFQLFAPTKKKCLWCGQTVPPVKKSSPRKAAQRRSR